MNHSMLTIMYRQLLFVILISISFYDTVLGLSVIATSDDTKLSVSIPKFNEKLFYKNEEILIDIKNETETNKQKECVVYHITAKKYGSNEKIVNLDSFNAQMIISFKLDRDNVSSVIRKPDAQELTLYRFNGIEWIRIPIKIEDDKMMALTNQLGIYMIKLASKPISFKVSKVYPEVFTPNGDNLNDIVEFQYENPHDSNPFGMIYTLQGVMIGELQKGNNFNTFIWDGKTLEGDTARPGAYIYQIEVTGSETKIINGIIVVAK